MPVTDKYAADRDEVTSDGNIVAEITEVTKRLIQAEQDAAEAEEVAKHKRAVVNAIKFKTLPEMFARMGGTDEIVVNIGGQRIPVIYEEKMAAKLSESKKEIVFAFLRNNGYENMINNNIVIPFTKGQAAEMSRFIEYVKNFDDGLLTIGQKEEVAPSTYTAWCDAHLKDNPGVDLADFGAHIVKQVKLGKPKTSKR